MTDAETAPIINEQELYDSVPQHEITEEDKEKANKAVIRILAAGFLYFFPVAVTFAVRPSIMVSACGGDNGKAAIFSSIIDASNALVAGFTSPLIGVWSDDKGRVPILQMCAIVEALGLFGITIFQNSLVGQFIFYQFIGFASSSQATLSAAIADVSYDAEQGHKSFARLNQVVAAAFFVGPILGGYLSVIFSDAVPMLIAAIILAIAAPFFGTFLIETRVKGENETESRLSLRESIRTMKELFTGNRALTFLVLALLIEALGENGGFNIYYMYTNERFGWTAETVGLFVAAAGFTLFVGQQLSARWTKYFGERRTIVSGFLSLGFHYAVYGLASKAWIMWVGLASGFPGFVSYPIITAVISRQVDMSLQGQFQGALFSLTNLLQPISSIGCAVLFSVGAKTGIPGLVFAFIAMCSFSAATLSNIGMKQADLK